MFTIQRASMDDCLLINRLATIVFPETYKDILSTNQIDYMLEWMYSPTSLCQQMNDGHAYFIAYKEYEACGYMSIEQEDEHLFHLQKIYVLPYFQGCHVGGFLFDEAMKYIRKVHPLPCRMELNVNRQNKALQFYEHMGMKKVREGDFAIGNGYYMNDYVMGMEL
ncbi:GNAT family N-acetyltransferase [uncultured Bacteroides sp.]|uniref:GNAT family N-acetyltransferase n=1 Tax=uncultured Bacteroides sp. TaxID=162156 RepID=UPI002AA6AC93|nr:GNAT family N-acetyltransferase [uncultured Bacteroides sp.]